MRFTNRGGELLSFVLKGGPHNVGEGLELVQKRAAPPYPFALVASDGGPLPIAQALFVAERQRRADAEELSFRYRGPLGEAAKKFVLRDDGQLELEVEARVGREWALFLGPGLRDLSAEQLTNRFARRAATWLVEGSLESEAPASAKAPTSVPGAGLRWVALEDNYFVTALVAREPWARMEMRPVLLRPAAGERVFTAEPLPPSDRITSDQKGLARDYEVLLIPNAGRLTATGYWGTKQYDRLVALGVGLEQTVHWGGLGFLARPLLWALQAIHRNVIENYGWAIVLLTLAIKLALLPLTHTAMTSMQKMQGLNPKVQAIRDKYRGKLKDKQGRFNPESQRQMNEEVMALYKSEGVNPAGGCLPMLLQLPVFLAFYNLLSAAVELWRAPWLGWVRDLSAPDPYFVLPIVMGATQLLQQKMTPAAADPMQRRLFQLFPIVFTVLSLGFPRGLGGYGVPTHLAPIAPQAVYHRLRAQKAAAATPAPRSGRKGRS